jgi:hypothetical protein
MVSVERVQFSVSVVYAWLAACRNEMLHSNRNLVEDSVVSVQVYK